MNFLAVLFLLLWNKGGLQFVISVFFSSSFLFPLPFTFSFTRGGFSRITCFSYGTNSGRVGGDMEISFTIALLSRIVEGVGLSFPLLLVL